MVAFNGRDGGGDYRPHPFHGLFIGEVKMNALMNLYRVDYEDNGYFDPIDPNCFVIYEIDPETGVVVDIQAVVYPME